MSDSCDPRDCSLPGSSIHGISQAGILEWVAIFFSRGFSWPRDWTRVSCWAGGFFTTESPGKLSFFFIMLIKTFSPIKIFIYKSLCTPENHMRSGSLSVHLLMCLQWLQFSVDKYLLSNEYKSFKDPFNSNSWIRNEKWATKCPTSGHSSQSRDSELHTLEKNELLVTEKEDGYWDSGEKNSPQYKPWENLVWLFRRTDLMKTGAKIASVTWYTLRIQTQRLLRPYPGFIGIKFFWGGKSHLSLSPDISFYFNMFMSKTKNMKQKTPSSLCG